jgi:RecA-family ATPase
MNLNHLHTIDGETLMNRPLTPIPFVIQSLLPIGLHILAGAPKVGKSWLALWLCLQVAKGEPVWSFATEKKKALYLCLEDSENRIQNRLFDITEDAPPDIHFAVCAGQIGDGLELQIENFVAVHPETGLIVIDTLQKVRRMSYDNAYANDYRDIGALKTLADKLGVAILLVHHLRKQHDDDPMNMVSGTTGITGAVDGSFVLAKHKRSSSKAVLVCSGRDIEYRELELAFDSATHVWQLILDSVENPADLLDDTVSLVCGYIKEAGNFLGTSSELVEVLEKSAGRKIPPGTLSKKLLRNSDELQRLGITCEFRRSNGKRIVELKCNSASSDGKNEMPLYPENAVPADPVVLANSTLLTSTQA